MGFYIDMIDVGEGDSFLLTLDDPGGGAVYVLIDGGTEEAGDKVVQHVTSHTFGTLALVIGTHLDNDHIGGLIKVVRNLTIQQFVLNVPEGLLNRWQGFKTLVRQSGKRPQIERAAKSLERAEELMNVLSANNLTPTQALAGQGWTCGEVQLNVLNPTPARLAAAWTEQKFEEMRGVYSPYRELVTLLGGGLQEAEAPPTTEENDSSIVIELVYKGSPYALLTSDAGAAVLKEVTTGKSYSYLKVPHHGSKTGLDEELVDRLRPRSAYIPVGTNEHGHPALEILELLKSKGIRTFCSQKTPNCRKACKSGGFGTVCHREGKDSRPNWNPINPQDCANNS